MQKQGLHDKHVVTTPAKALFNNANVTQKGEEIIYLGRRCQYAVYMTSLQSQILCLLEMRLCCSFAAFFEIGVG
jgi:hypothetical protein